MILEPKSCNAHLVSSWTAGVGLVCLGIGLHGAVQPLFPNEDSAVVLDPAGEVVAIENFQAPASQFQDAPRQAEKLEDAIDIPPLPEMVAPFIPPEMPEIIPLEEARQEPKPEPAENKADPPKVPLRNTSNSLRQMGGGGDGDNSPLLFSGGGSGQFPSPAYPASARSANHQGTVRLLVTVAASGAPSSVQIMSSSGFAVLDNAASSTVRRSWRWPSGGLRKFIVPVRFILH